MDGLRYALTHNSWATGQLIEACRGLTAEQLEATAPGGFGSLMRTLAHIVEAEGWRFRPLLSGTRSDLGWQRGDVPDLDALAAAAEDNARFWQDLPDSPIDGEHPVEVEWQSTTYHVAAGVVLAQVAHHGNAHREQASAILTTLGVEPPDISGWGFGGATGRIVPATS
jgi:uncharacterized damage-inducible protein DinB